MKKKLGFVTGCAVIGVVVLFFFDENYIKNEFFGFRNISGY